jgi:subtilase family serine protease
MRFPSALQSVAMCAAIFPFSISSVSAASRQTLSGHVPEAIAQSSAAGRVPTGTSLNLVIGLPLRNPGELDAFLQQLADPASPNFRRYLTPEQFAERFGPTEEDYRTLAAYFRAQGFVITGTHPNRVILDIRGTVAQIESTFEVNLLYWNHPTRGRFFAPDREPSLDAGVTILDVSGLDNFVVPRPMNLQSRPLSEATPFTTGSGPGGLFIGTDYRHAYAPSVTLNGAGQSVGLFELDGFYANDVAANFAQAGLTPVPVRTVLLDGVSGSPGSGNVEVTLDIMMASYMAPGVTNIIVYEGDNPDDVLNRMATDNLASQLSSSWGWSPMDQTTDQIFRQMVAQGQSLFQASGDDGSYQNGVMPPADDPNLTVVGGTSLTTAGAGGVWQSETAWSYSGGGVSTTWTIPSYQPPAAMRAAGGSASMRNIPDVALLADVQIFLICNDGQAIEVGGTSAAAPLWAGFIALANQQASSSQQPRVGFLNPLIYALGAGSNYQSDVHDIVSGSNGGFSAQAGYDLVTGWGTPAGQPLINSLTGVSSGPSFSLSSSASTLSIAAGASGTSTITVSAQQGFSAAVSLSASGLPSGVTASFSPASATTSSTLTLIASSSAVAGTSTVTITGTSGSLTSTARIAVTISAPPSFALSATPATLTAAKSSSAASTIAIQALNGFAGTVSLSASGLPSGVTASFTAASATTPSTLTLTISSSAATGSSTVTVTGTSGSLRATTSIALTINAAGGFTLAASPATLNITAGASATASFTVTPQTGFSGTVSFSASGLPSGVTASFSPASSATKTTLTLAASAAATVGSATITITGTSGAVTSRATLALTVAAAPGFTLSASPSSLTVVAGATATSAITVNAQNGFTGTVTLTASALPAGVTGSFSPSSTSHSSTVTFTASSTAAATTATVTISGVSGALNSKISVTLSVTKPPTFTLSISPASLSIAAGATGTATLTLTPQNGFSSPVTVTISGLPASVTPSFNASSATLATLSLSAGVSAAPTSATVSINAKAGSISQTVTLALTITAGSKTTAGSVNLASSYNVMGMVADGAKFLSSSGLDGGGRAYSANLLGTVRTAGGATFNFGPSNASGAVSGGTIALPAGSYTTLTLLAAGVNGNQVSQNFTVTYTDGSTASFTQSLSDWCMPQNYTGESNAIPMSYRDLSNGTTDVRTVMLYAYTLNLSSSKTVKSITLPSNRNVVVMAMSLGAATSSSAHAMEGKSPNGTYNLGRM